ncbi:receptor kinase-like protein Xa21 [Tasmannia lanceolata]|uniref:receptor kinase-like protein Xa21 n=1 Tax=Tasmannia lanceolata TaxID=3420 RepID=UPI0040643313
MALLAFKDGITSDPLGALSSWNHTLHFCQWNGVTCGRRHQRVTVLNLSGQNLVGTLSPAISNLTFLREIHLQENSFNGQISQDIGRLFRLRHLNMSYNSLGGEIPSNLTHCRDLGVIDLGYNELTGKIPIQLSTLPKLSGLFLFHNNLEGSIPPQLGNVSTLTLLYLYANSLVGPIPDDLARINNLKRIVLSGNLLSGTVPSSFYNNLSFLVEFTVSQNLLNGTLPPNIGFSLSKLRYLLLGINQFTGHIPISLSNVSSLEWLLMGGNQFSGPVPENIGWAKNLLKLQLDYNYLGLGRADDLKFITSLSNCSNLNELSIQSNHFVGLFPNSIANLSTHLYWLSIGQNQISGNIPSQIGNLINLENLGLYETFITGSIPTSIGMLQNLQQLYLGDNKLSEKIPYNIGNITRLTTLDLGFNNLQGTIPLSLANCTELLALSLSRNNLHGTIPKQIIGLSSLSKLLALSQNFFTGSLPSDVGNLQILEQLDVSQNKLSGEIPSTLANCKSMRQLYMQGNAFRGDVSSVFTTLTSIEALDLSYNNFSGKIPKYLEGFKFLQYLNLSFNNFEGEVQKQGVFGNASAISVMGNDNLCGGILELKLPTCPVVANDRRGKTHVSRVIILVTSAVVCLIFLLCVPASLYWIRKSRKKPSSLSSMEGRHLKVSYAELCKATDGFSSANLIGTGSYGSVYKGILSRIENVVAVKVLNLHLRGASKSFIAECNALRNIRHRNLVKIITSCSSIDFGGNDFKALVLEFMPNGSLEKWLHSKFDGQHKLGSLNFIKRLNIAIDIAYALDYLHHHCHTPIAHCDLKPSNIFLDEDMNAHVGDFGLAKFYPRIIQSSSEDQSSTTGLKGTIGYIAPDFVVTASVNFVVTALIVEILDLIRLLEPRIEHRRRSANEAADILAKMCGITEYGAGGHVSTTGDVYSYGILLLEIFTGKRPTDEMFKDGLSLHKLVQLSLPDRVMEILDPLVLVDDDEGRATNITENYNDKIRRLQECLVSERVVDSGLMLYLVYHVYTLFFVMDALEELIRSYTEPDLEEDSFENAQDRDSRVSGRMESGRGLGNAQDRDSRYSRSPERIERHHQESDEIDRGSSQSDNERSISHRRRQREKEAYRNDRSKGREIRIGEVLKIVGGKEA